MGTKSMAAGTGKAKKIIKAIPLAVMDVVAVAAAWIISTWGEVLDARLITPEAANMFAVFIGGMAAVTLVLFAALRMYSTLWEYASVDELARVIVAVVLDVVVGYVAYFLVFGQLLPVPCAIGGLAIMLVVCGASRFLVRLHSTRGWSVLGINEASDAPRSLVVGAGETGALTVTRMLANNPDMPGNPIVLVDDNPDKLGERIRGIKVCGAVEDIPALCKANRIEQIVIAVPSATREERDRILQSCIKSGVRTLTLPMVQDMPREADAKIPLREVEISDLLARDEIALDLGQMGYVTGKRVLVTGGGGSIGSELVRQLIPAKPAQIILFDIYENTAYELFHEIARPAQEQGIDVQVFIGSITHLPAIGECFEKYKPEVVFHAAAHKHVPLMEHNAREAIENNIFGTLNVVRLADKYGCTHFVQISTDKAVNPANVMGATKRFDEMIVQYYAQHSKTVFTAVRFGNVLGSHGSVIPLFKRQLAQGGPITVTHKDITRYFMTIPEASRLVITAGALAKGGEIFVLNMGEPVRIYDLAVNLVTLSGLKPGRDLEIKVTGLRPGEKMYEELLMDTEKLLPTENSQIRISTGEADDLSTMKEKLGKLEACLDGTNDDIKAVLADVVPTYHPQYND